MRRRELIAFLGSSLAGWPLAARAQQPERIRRVVFLHSLAENDPEVQARIAVFRRELETLGLTENRNVQIEHRFSGGDFARIQALRRKW
jgi:putative tryptophan/tyrosine transport system substrate-binding protein